MKDASRALSLSFLMNEHTYEKYIERWNSRFGESQSAEVFYSSHGVILPMTINRLSREMFEHAKGGLRELQEEFDRYTEIGNEEGMERALLEMIPYEVVLLISI